MFIFSYQPGSPLLKRYIEMNNIKSAFVFKEDERQWQAYIGDAVTRQGFKLGEPQRTKREALELASKANELIASVEK